jgi:hypothetical protein
VHKYADGGKVLKSETDADKPKKKVKRGGKKPQAKLTEYSGMSVREKQMKDMGLADGGRVRTQADVQAYKAKYEMPPPEKGAPPKQITTEAPPGGRYTPGAKAKDLKHAKPVKKMACGGKVKK